jgi:hypothetical protein
LGEAIISLDDLHDCVAHPPAWINQNHISAGCDFAAGGEDSCCLSIARGNKLEIAKALAALKPETFGGPVYRPLPRPSVGGPLDQR